MASKYSVKIRTIVEELGLTPLHTSADYDTRILTVADVNRPALQLTGFYNYFDPKRLQIIGRVESTYLELKTADERRNCFEELMKLNIAALVICHNTVAFPECLEMAEKYDCNVFTTTEDTSDFMANVIVSLHTHLAPRTTVHGVLVEVHGEGVMITGESGVGKSENAMALLSRGHRLVADDAIEVKRTAQDTLVGSSPELIRYFMEIRGIGIMHIPSVFGVCAVRGEKHLELIITFKRLDDVKGEIDRIGQTRRVKNILGVDIPNVVIPVSAGRDLVNLVETAAMQQKLIMSGYDPVQELSERLRKRADIMQFDKNEKSKRKGKRNG